MSDDWHDWKRLHAIEWPPEPPPRRWRGLLELVVLALVVGVGTAAIAYCARPTPPVPWQRAAASTKARQAAVQAIAPARAKAARTRDAVATARATRDSTEAAVALRPLPPVGLVAVEQLVAERDLRSTLEAHVAALEAELAVTRAALDAAIAAEAAWREVVEASRCRLLWWDCPSRTQVAVVGLVVGVTAGLAAGR